MRPTLRGVLDELCHTVDLLIALAAIELVLLLVAVAGVLYLEPGSAPFVVWLLNAAGLVVLLAVTVPLVVLCFRR
jgi:membrane protein YdbS with pleckstrin-like domain